MSLISRYTQGFDDVNVLHLIQEHILSEENAPPNSQVTFVSAYTNAHGVLLLAEGLANASERGVYLKAVVDRNGCTKEGLNALCRFFDEVILIAFNGLIFHPKQFTSIRMNEDACLGAITIEGSANLTGPGLSLNIEEALVIEYSADEDAQEIEGLLHSVNRKSDPESLVHGREMGLASPEEPQNAVWVIKDANGQLIQQNHEYVSQELDPENRKRSTRTRKRTNDENPRRMSGRSAGRRTLPLPEGVSVSQFRDVNEVTQEVANENRQEATLEATEAILEEIDAKITIGEVDDERIDTTVIGLIGECDMTQISAMHAPNEAIGADLVGVYKSLAPQDAELIHGGAGSSEMSWPAVGRCLSGDIGEGAGNALTIRVRTYDVLTGDIVETENASIYRRVRPPNHIEDRITLNTNVWHGGHLRSGDIAVFVGVRSMAGTTPLAQSLALGEGDPHLLMIIVPQAHPLHSRFPTYENGRGQGTLRLG